MTIPKRGLPKRLTELAESAAERRAKELIDQIQFRKLEIADHFYDIGLAFHELQRKKLYAVLGYPSFAQMVVEKKLFGLSQAKKLVAVVTSMPRETALSLGPERAYAAVRYAAATPEVDSPAGLLASGTKIDGQPMSSLSAAALMRAATEKRREQTPHRLRSPEEIAARAAAKKLQAFLRAHGVARASIAARRHKGLWMLFAEIGVEEVARLTGKRRK
jgi:hypothetical protein